MENKNMRIIEYSQGMTVRQLKELVKDWPEEDEDGDPTEVWIGSGKHSSSPVTESSPLNMRKNEEGKTWADILFESDAFYN